MQEIKNISKIAIKTFFSIPASAFMICFLALAVICVVSLRSNNQTMIKLRNDVYAADQANGDVNTAINKLRSFVYAHMNTDISSGTNGIKPPIQLKYTYERLQSAAQAAATNTGLYTQAENYCQDQIPASVSISGRGRISCVSDYILSHGGTAAAAVPVGLYEFDFLSPTWSPDLAGWTMLASLIAFICFAIKFLSTKF